MHIQNFKLKFFDKMKNRLIKCILKRYCGAYLEDFSEDQLTTGITAGKCALENVKLNVEKLNSVSEEYNLPIEILHGSVDYVGASIPWAALMRQNIILEIKGLRIVVQPKSRPEDASIFDSMWCSTTSSMQLAKEISEDAEDDEYDEETVSSKGSVHTLAHIIDLILANIKIVFHDSSFKMEYVPEGGGTGITLEIKIASAEYSDEAGVNTTSSDSNASQKKDNDYEPQSYSFKRLIFEGISMFTSQFSDHSRLFLPKTGFPSNYMDPSSFIPGSPEMPPTHSSFPVRRSEPELSDDPILISKLHGQQVLRLKLKQNEAIVGPKVDVEFNLGAFNLFLIPQQVHMLYELLSGLMKPSSFNEPNKKHPLSVANKPMKATDYALVEQELLRQQQKSDVPSKSLRNQHGWSSHSLDESDEEFQLMAMESRGGSEFPTLPLNDNDSLCSSISSDTRSDCAGNFYGSNQRQAKPRGSTVQAMLQDQLSELTHFHGCLSSVLVIILHDDSVQESFGRDSTDASETNSKSMCSLKERAETFFHELLALQLSGQDFKDFASSRDPLSKLCDTNHLRLMASSVTIDGNEKSSSVQCVLNFSLSMLQFEILECLFNSTSFVQDPTYVELLSCDNIVKLEDDHTESEIASLKLKYQQTEYTTQSRHIKPPCNRLDVQFGLLSCEVDISITDRIQTLLNLFVPTDAKQNSDDSDTTRSSPKTEIIISSPNLTINMRFPVPDLRSVHDMERVPWWQQNLHPEVLIMKTKDITLKTVLDGDETQSKYEIQCRDLHGLLKKSEAEEPISFLRVSVDPDVDEITQNKGFDWPRLVIHQNTKAPGSDLESGLEDPVESYYSLGDVLMSNLGSEPSPFCSTSVAYGSKLHCRNNNVEDQTDNSGGDQEEVIKPADKETLLQFVEDIVNKSECLLEFSLPTVNISFPDKEFFELLYNRLGSDLLLWQKTAFTTKAPYDPVGFNVHISGLDLNGHNPTEPASNNFSHFRPFPNDSNSDSEEEETNYYSFFEKVVQKRQKHKNDNSNAFTKLSINISITKGSLAIHAPTLDMSNKVIPGVCGKLQLYAEDGQIFIASSYRGDPNENYLCILSEKSALYHNGAMPLPVELPTMEPLRGKPNNIQCIIYESDPEMHLKTVCDINGTTDMLKIAVHMVHTPKQQLKNFKVAIDISDATLRHYMTLVPQLWINQLIDFLKVQDFSVNGYTPSAVVTEFHLNLSNCAIDYRPLNLPLRSAITVENFNMSCNIAATTPTFLFRLISEEMRFFISSIMTARKVDLQKNYVCIIDSGLIDVSFRTCEDEKNNAKLELSATNNIIHIRTCADSFKALMDLMIYVSAHADMDASLLEDAEENKESKQSVSKASDAENLHLLMAEAMKDCPYLEVPEYRNADRDSPENEVTVNTDDEFCILEDETGVGFMPKNGEPQIRVLTDGPIKIVENHFSVPPGKSDVLKAPKHFPKPVVLVTLREMSLVWHLYGGYDLKTSSGKKKSLKKKEKEVGVTFADTKSIDIDASNNSVTFCKVTPLPTSSISNVVNYQMEHVTIEHPKEGKIESWLQKGGANRNHDILMELQMKKVQFQHEVYPPGLEYASRYVLLIHDIEVRDRLKSSGINKFLYQYSSQKIPRQSHADMIEVKAVYTRPDPALLSEECSLHVSCRPLRLNVDQDSLFFLVGFFRDSLGIEESSEDPESKEKDAVSPTNNVVHMPLVKQQNNTAPETFYRVFSFSPDVLIRIDYQGKRVLMEQGALKGLLMGLGQLNSSEIKLKRIHYRHGLLGHHKVLSYALNEWQQDILKNQLPSILGGLGPMNSFVIFFQGVKDFFCMPVEQYRRDGQIVRGLQRGASSFSSSALMAFLDLCSGVVSTIHGAASVGFDMVSYGPSVANRAQGSLEYHQPSQPADIREGFVTALNVVKEGLGDTARTFYGVAVTEHEHKGMPGAVGGILRQIPPTIFTPLIVGSKASSYIIGGVRHQLMPDAHQEDIHKWRTKS